MIIDDKGRLFGKISIVDILIVAVLVLAIGGVYYKFGRSGTATPFSKSDTIEITFYQEDTQSFNATSIKVGDVVKDRQQNITLGMVVSVTVGPDVVFYPNSDGKVVSSSKEGYSSVKFTVRGQGIYSDTAFSMGGMEYYVNKYFETRVGKVNIYPRITSFEKVEE